MVSAATNDSERYLEDRTLTAEGIVRRNVYWAMGIGVVPIPLIDLVGITTVQIKMLKQLSDMYQVPFYEHKVKNIVSSLLGGVASVGFGKAVALSLLKFIPGIGLIAGAVAVPIAAGALTHAMGKLFIQHFESGGTFLDFDPKAVREHFRQEFDSSKSVVERMHAQHRVETAGKPLVTKPTP